MRSRAVSCRSLDTPYVESFLLTHQARLGPSFRALGSPGEDSVLLPAGSMSKQIGRALALSECMWSSQPAQWMPAKPALLPLSIKLTWPSTNTQQRLTHRLVIPGSGKRASAPQVPGHTKTFCSRSQSKFLVQWLLGAYFCVYTVKVERSG